MGGSPSVPDPAVAATQGIQQNIANYPFETIINALAQEGGTATLQAPGASAPQTYDFTGLGTADVQNTVSQQMAQTLLDIQSGMGSQYIAQRLADLQQADPQGYAAYQQLFDQIQTESAAAPPDQALSTSTQNQILGVLQNSASLTPEEQMQVQQAVRGNQVQSGIYLGNAPTQAEASATVQAQDQKQSAAQNAASQYLSAGVSPSDIQYRQIQQDLSNLGAFESGATPTSQFSSLSGAQTGAAPYVQTGYSTPTINESGAASTGINNALDIYGANYNWANNQVNPYIAGLNLGTNLLGTAANLGYSPFGTVGGNGTTTFGAGYSGVTGPGYALTTSNNLDLGTP